MTLHSVRVRNFQSLHDVSVELKAFTVIVGPSSSGKSAFTRALRTLVSNRRGTEWITTGEKVASITATTTDGTVTLTRSRTASATDNHYVITPDDDPTRQQKFAKLGGETPEDVSRFLGIASGTTANPPINFAGQFDKPFLLDDSAGDVARTLGALTNVSVIFDGARESNRRKLAQSQALKIRAADLEAIRARTPEFQLLKEQAAALERAEQAIPRARDLQRKLTRLQESLKLLETLQPSLERLEELAARPVPDDARVVAALEALRRFKETLRQVGVLSRGVKAAEDNLAALEGTEAELLARYSQLSGEITADVRKFFDAHVRQEFVRDGFVEIGHAAAVFGKFLETRAGA